MPPPDLDTLSSQLLRIETRRAALEQVLTREDGDERFWRQVLRAAVMMLDAVVAVHAAVRLDALRSWSNAVTLTLTDGCSGDRDSAPWVERSFDEMLDLDVLDRAECLHVFSAVEECPPCPELDEPADEETARHEADGADAEGHDAEGDDVDGGADADPVARDAARKAQAARAADARRERVLRAAEDRELARAQAALEARRRRIAQQRVRRAYPTGPLVRVQIDALGPEQAVPSHLFVFALSLSIRGECSKWSVHVDAVDRIGDLTPKAGDAARTHWFSRPTHADTLYVVVAADTEERAREHLGDVEPTLFDDGGAGGFDEPSLEDLVAEPCAAGPYRLCRCCGC